jgi:hypothetical protein
MTLGALLLITLYSVMSMGAISPYVEWVNTINIPFAKNQFSAGVSLTYGSLQGQLGITQLSLNTYGSVHEPMHNIIVSENNLTGIMAIVSLPWRLNSRITVSTGVGYVAYMNAPLPSTTSPPKAIHGKPVITDYTDGITGDWLTQVTLGIIISHGLTLTISKRWETLVNTITYRFLDTYPVSKTIEIPYEPITISAHYLF